MGIHVCNESLLCLRAWPKFTRSFPLQEFACVTWGLGLDGSGGEQRIIDSFFLPVWVGRKVAWFEMSAGGCRFLLSQAGEDEDHLIFLKCGGQACAGERLKDRLWADTWGPFLLSRAVKCVNRAKKGYSRLLCHKNHRDFWEIFPASVFLNGKTESAWNNVFKSAGIVLLLSTYTASEEHA